MLKKSVIFRRSESSAEVELQSSLDHTATRILKSQKGVLDRLPSRYLDLDL